MKMAVCVKQVPEVADAELEVRGGVLDTDDLVFDLNEWDVYAVEEAVRLKEKLGGHVTVVTIGDEDAADGLYRALAMGADAAVHVDGGDFEGSDARGVAAGLAAVLSRGSYDLVLTGAQASDTGWGQVGPQLAARLGLPWTTLAIGIEPADGSLVVVRELEDNTAEKVQLQLPALVTVQTGINQPRYVSIMGIRRARGIAVEELGADDLGVEVPASGIASRRLSLPERGAGARMLDGPLADTARELAGIVRDRLGRSA